MKTIKIISAVVVGLLSVACYNDFDIPAEAKIWQDSDLQRQGLQQISIAAVKAQFSAQFGGISGTGDNSSWDDTKTLKFGEPFPGEDKYASNGTKFWTDAAAYYIKGKVISSDEQGNIYKSLYIWDGTAAIELKLSGTLYTTYKLNLATMESTWVYVPLDGLYLGNYRMMLSIGGAPTDSYNVVKEHKFYANSNLELPEQVQKAVLRGEPCQIEADDILTVDATNYKTALGEKALGRLVRFNGVKVRYAGVKNQDGVTPAAMKNGTYDNIFPSWVCTDVRPIVNGAWYYWGYSYNNDKLYGSVQISYNDAAVYTSDPGVYSVRTSGYSRFAMNPIPKDGTEGNVLGIFAIYSKQSTFTGGSRDYAQYQITVSRYEDLEFPASSLLSESWIEENTPADSYNPPVVDGTDSVTE